MGRQPVTVNGTGFGGEKMKQITKQILNLPGESLFVQTLRDNIIEFPDQCIKMIKDQATDKRSRPGVIKAIGDELLKMIEDV